MLFLGKLAIEDIPVLYQACQEGILTPQNTYLLCLITLAVFTHGLVLPLA